jgi:hypothetical protein
MQSLLMSCDAGIIDEQRYHKEVLIEVHKGSMLYSWESVVVKPTGKQNGTLVEITMHDRKGEIIDARRNCREWWTHASNIIQQRSV